MAQVKTEYKLYDEIFLYRDRYYCHDLKQESISNQLSDLLASEFICYDRAKKRSDYIIQKMLSNARVLFVK